MPASRRFLALCERLHQFALIKPNFEVGERIGRGFADLGAEEFQIVGANRIISLFTGQFSELADSDRQFFFLIPDVDHFAEILCRAGFDIDRIERPEQRQWLLTLKAVNRSGTCSYSGETLLETFAQALLAIER